MVTVDSDAIDGDTALGQQLRDFGIESIIPMGGGGVGGGGGKVSISLEIEAVPRKRPGPDLAAVPRQPSPRR